MARCSAHGVQQNTPLLFEGVQRLMKRLLTAATLLLTVAVATWCHAQDAREALGPRDNAALKKSPHPISELMRTRVSKLRPELEGKHPRVYVTDSELQILRTRAKTTHKELWQQVLGKLRALQQDPPPPPAEKRRAQNEVGIAIVEAALAYKIEGDPRYLAAARKYMDAAVSYDVWGYAYNKPNIDLAAGHLLYGLGTGYDLLYNDLSDGERAKYRNKLAKQAKLLADAYRPKPGRTYSYSQNHVFIPMAGLGVAAYALYGEVPEAAEWAALVRAIYDRVLDTYSPDGYYYEGFEYWVFSTPWIIHYLDAHLHSTGEDLYDRPGLRQTHLYVAHSVLPGGKDMFDFGDVFEGPITRAKHGEDYERSHPGGNLASNYNLLYRLAQKYRDPQIQGVATWLGSKGQVNAEDFWSLFWFEPSLQATPIDDIPTWHYFRDHEVVYWRTDWSDAATAIAFKCGPPEGHHTADSLKRFPDWHLSAGHSHPDANSFIIFAKGKYLSGDSGYAGLPKTDQHNTLLVDNLGQGNEGLGHDPWDDVPYDTLNRVRIESVEATKSSLEIVGEAAAAYTKVDLQQFKRKFRFDGQRFTVEDTLRAATPRTFTTLLHSDTSVRQTPSGYFLGADNPGLAVRVLQPASALTNIEPNIVRSPGPPGNVDKGQMQNRGERLAITTPEKATHATFSVQLTVE